jgi:DNA-nicking Smr family endonuclease
MRASAYASGGAALRCREVRPEPPLSTTLSCWVPMGQNAFTSCSLTRTTRDGDTGAKHGRGRSLSPEEVELWRRATGDVERLDRPRERPIDRSGPRADVPSPAPKPQASINRPPQLYVRPLEADAAAPGSTEPGSPGIDKRTRTRLLRGQIPPQSHIDLHHRTQAEAHRLLRMFLEASQSAGLRCVLVITGKGYRSDGSIGVLKTMVPRWLGESPNSERVLTFSPAKPWHGGDGALYVLLRRSKRGPSR